jgi:NAD-dependent SIR2 family protein deacetylase
MAVQCSKCKEEIPEGRLKALPGATTCVSCSNSRMKRSVTVVKGEGEDTFNDLIILEADEYESIFGKDHHTGFVFPEDSLVEDAED